MNFVVISISYYWIYPSYVSGGLQGKTGAQVKKSKEGVNSKEKFNTSGQTWVLRASFPQHSAKISDFRRDLFLFQLQISAQLLPFWKGQCWRVQAWQNYRVTSDNFYMSGVSDRKLAKSIGSRRCSESNSKSFPKWRKKFQLTEFTKVSEVPTVQHKHWVNAKEKSEQPA